MLLSRTRKEIKIIESFYKEAGLDQEIQHISKTNLQQETKQKKDRLIKKKSDKQDASSKADTKSTSERQFEEFGEDATKNDIKCQHDPTPETRSLKSTLLLDKILNKLSIVKILDQNIVEGCYGHSTVIFERPIMEGQYYLEFKILKPNLNSFKAKINEEPSVRFGFCPPSYSKSSPLGQNTSLGFKSSNGRVVTKGQEKHGSGKFEENDIIGLGLSFSPPHKYQNKNELWEGSKVVITKNGSKITESSEIYQEFYCPAFSLFNYASLEIRLNKESQEFNLEGFQPYENIFNERDNSDIFKN